MVIIPKNPRGLATKVLRDSSTKLATAVLRRTPTPEHIIYIHLEFKPLFRKRKGTN